MKTQKQNLFKVGLAIFLIIAGALARLVPHPANFTPIAAIALFGGKQLPQKLALAIPLGALFLSDVFIGFYTWQIMLAVYGCFLLTAILGQHLTKKFSASRLLGLTIVSSIIFYLTTNAAVWAFGNLYSPDLRGLILSYWYGLPFFRNELMGNFFYVIILFGAQEVIDLLYNNFRRRNFRILDETK